MWRHYGTLAKCKEDATHTDENLRANRDRMMRKNRYETPEEAANARRKSRSRYSVSEKGRNSAKKNHEAFQARQKNLVRDEFKKYEEELARLYWWRREVEQIVDNFNQYNAGTNGVDPLELPPFPNVAFKELDRDVVPSSQGRIDRFCSKIKRL